MLAPMESNILSFFFNTVPLPLFPALLDSDVARVCEAAAATLQAGASARPRRAAYNSAPVPPGGGSSSSIGSSCCASP